MKKIMKADSKMYKERFYKWSQYKSVVATFIIHLNSINVGMCQGYSAVLLPQLLNPGYSENMDDTFVINAEEASWIASLGVISNPIGALLSGILMDTCGRKVTICYTTVPLLFGWITIGLSADLYMLCIGRCIAGLAIGMSASCYVYVAEISSPSCRGFLSSFGPIFVSLGVLIVYVLGYLLNWQSVAFLCALTAILSLGATLFLPESPSWLASNGFIEEATDSLVWLGKDQATIDAELADILEMVKVSRNTKPHSFKEHVRYCKRASVWKPFSILIVFFILQELSGIYVVLFYAVDFFQHTGTIFNDHVASIMVGSVRFLVSIIGAVCIQSFKRKTMAAISGLAMALTMATAALYELTNVWVQPDARPMTWIPFTCILVNVASSMLGFLQLPWLMIGELFPLAVRGLMGGIVSSLAYLFIFITVKCYPLVLETVKLHGMLCIFTGAALTAAAFAVNYLPETKDKSLYQIEKSFLNDTTESKENLPSSLSQTIPNISISVESRTF